MTADTGSPDTESSAARIASPGGNDLGADARQLIANCHHLRNKNRVLITADRFIAGPHDR